MSEESLVLFKHVKRPEWGLAVIAWERDGKRAYLFDSGMVKVLAEPFYRFMKPVEQSENEHTALLDRLAGQLDHGGERVSARAGSSSISHFTLEEQVSLFRSEFPDGFESDAWLKKMRGVNATRRLKRHRNAAIEDITQKLSAEQLQQYVESNQAEEGWQQVCECLEATDLVPGAQLTALRNRLSRGTVEGLACLSRLIHAPADADIAPVFDEFVQTLRKILGKAPGWELTTAALALSKPGVHVCVRRSGFQKQAEWYMPQLHITKNPSAVTYAGFLNMAHSLNDKLAEAGLAPVDLLDVHDFIKQTTSPSAQQRMYAIKQGTLEPPESAIAKKDGKDGKDDDDEAEAA